MYYDPHHIKTVGDTVLMSPAEADQLPYIAKILLIASGFPSPDPVMVRVKYFYRPEQTIEGRKSFHGPRELLFSNHIDDMVASRIIGKCSVWTYRSFSARLVNGSSESNDYYCRFDYEIETGKSTPALATP
jgi:anti-sigma factor RsiW